MKENIKKKIEEMYKNVNSRSIEVVFYGKRIKKSIGLRKPPSDILRELDGELGEKKRQKSK